MECEPDILTAVISALSFVAELSAEDYLEVDESQCAVVAAEVVASARAGEWAILPAELVRLVKENQNALKDAAIVQTARVAVERVVANSELAELWAEGDGPEDWKRGMVGLVAKLA